MGTSGVPITMRVAEGRSAKLRRLAAASVDTTTTGSLRANTTGAVARADRTSVSMWP